MRPKVQVSGGNQIGHKLRQMRQRLGMSQVYVGLPQGSGQYEDGTPMAVIGAVQEFGSADGHIPERSFLRVPLRGNQELFANIFQELLPKVVEGQIDMRQLLEQVGQRAAATSQEAISEGITPPNAPSTVQRKGSSTPLVDTGALRQNITYVIQEADQ